MVDINLIRFDMKWFRIEELIRCYREDGRCKECPLVQRAERVSYGVEENARALVENVLDPAREALRKPICVNSGFRCTIHNLEVGGSVTSQHLLGEAADVSAGSPEENLQLARLIVENGRFDQLILYPTFVHVSFKRNGRNRKEVLKKTCRGYQRVKNLLK